MTSETYSQLLAMNEIVQCRVTRDIHGLGYMRKQESVKGKMDAINPLSQESGPQSKDLEEDSKVEIPLWLAKAWNERQIVEIDLPRHYTGKFLTGLKVGGDHVNLSEQSPYYYSNGVECAKLCSDENIDRVLPTLTNAFVVRFKNILLQAQNFQRSQFSSFTQNLTQDELDLFDITRKSYESYQDWKSNERM